MNPSFAVGSLSLQPPGHSTQEAGVLRTENSNVSGGARHAAS